jgi:UDP-N-acetylmuramoyl-tripeptide--D-alanyl-D-alanine ligase
MTFWNPDNLRSILAGTWLARPPANAIATGLSHDTRTLKPGQVFLAIKGERIDGHALLEHAKRAGASLAIVDHPEAIGPLPAGLGILRVNSTEKALLALASAYRDTLTRTVVIAVCGSNGKTTSVRLLDAALSASMRGSHSPKSFNNHLGVPLTILAASPDDAYLICEIGTNAKGEIATLASVARPDLAIITSIGREHLEKLGSIAEVAREEASVLEHVRASGSTRVPGAGAGIVNADAPHLLEAVARLASRPSSLVRFGRGERADIRLLDVRHDSSGGMTITLNDRAAFRVPLAGEHNAMNTLGAIAAARRLGLKDDAIASGLSRAKPPEMRLERSDVRGIRVINDAYNANPDSVRAALATIPDLMSGASRRVVVLGDMLELGSHSEPEHRLLGEDLASRRDLDLLILVGSAMRHAALALRERSTAEVRQFDSLDAAALARITSLLREGDAVLLKGSRGMRLERILSVLRGERPAVPA